MNNAFQPSDILLPNQKIDMNKWSVIACDQYTSEPEYWNDVDKIISNNPSSLNLILPEIYLEDKDVDNRISQIHKKMNEFVSNDIFQEYENSMIYVERIQSNGIIRQGIIGKIDLEQYDYNKGSTSPVRATEATVIERIPPRIKVRNGASLELPHIMILIDDEKNSVIEPINCENLKKLYDFELMKNGGSIKGYLIDEKIQNQIINALDNLGDLDKFNAKYNVDEKTALVYAMGDGNHSLATAKEFYEQLKRENIGVDMSNHPARYALVEIVNLHSKALEFEAIHRIVTDVDNEKLISEMTIKLGLSEENGSQLFSYYCNGIQKNVYINNPTSNLTVGSLQAFLDDYLKQNGGKIDYIHGIDVVKMLSDKNNGIGFILPDMDKNELFPTVIKDGALPRKTFSMGHAEDKRYYIECRKIK